MTTPDRRVVVNHLGACFTLNALSKGSEAVSLEGFITLNDPLYFLDFIKARLIDLKAEDEQGHFTLQDLSGKQVDGFLQVYLGTTQAQGSFLDSYLVESGLSRSLQEELRQYFKITSGDTCECPVCQPNSNGNYKEDTPANRKEYHCLRAGFSRKCRRVSYFTSLVRNASDPLDMPLWLFQAYQIAENERWIQEGKRSRELKVKRKEREIEEKQKRMREKYNR